MPSSTRDWWDGKRRIKKPKGRFASLGAVRRRLGGMGKKAVEFVDPFPNKAPGDPISHQELVSALRLSIAAELEAAHLYDTIAEYTKDERVKKIMKDVADEEQVHAGEFQHVLELVESDEKEKMEEGVEEAKEKLAMSLGTGGMSAASLAGGKFVPRRNRLAGGGARITTGTGTPTIVGSKAGSKATRPSLGLKTGMPLRKSAFMRGFVDELDKVAAAAGPPTLAKLRRAAPTRKATPRVANPRAVAEKMNQIEKGATVRGRIRYLVRRLSAPLRREKARALATKAADKGQMRKALRYGGVGAGLGPSFGRGKSRTAETLLRDLRALKAQA